MGRETGGVGIDGVRVSTADAPLVSLPLLLLLLELLVPFPLLLTDARGVAVVAVITVLLLPGFERDLFIVLLSSSETFSSSLSILFRGDTCCWWDELNTLLKPAGGIRGALFALFATRTVNCCTIASSSFLRFSRPLRLLILKSFVPFSNALAATPLVCCFPFSSSSSLPASEDFPFTLKSIASTSAAVDGDAVASAGTLSLIIS